MRCERIYINGSMNFCAYSFRSGILSVVFVRCREVISDSLLSLNLITLADSSVSNVNLWNKISKLHYFIFRKCNLQKTCGKIQLELQWSHSSKFLSEPIDLFHFWRHNTHSPQENSVFREICGDVLCRFLLPVKMITRIRWPEQNGRGQNK